MDEPRASTQPNSLHRDHCSWSGDRADYFPGRSSAGSYPGSGRGNGSSGLDGRLRLLLSDEATVAAAFRGGLRADRDIRDDIGKSRPLGAWSLQFARMDRAGDLGRAGDGGSDVTEARP